jgi:glutamyl-tRNA(Gln) amidotransferase subunit D
MTVKSAKHVKPGDEVEVETADEKITGTLMPTPELQKGLVIIKLDNGYNVGIDKKKIKKINLIKKVKAMAAPTTKEKPVTKKNLPKITILHTGGTIASKVDYRTGAVVARFSPKEILDMFPELKEIANIDSRPVRSMFSEDMRFAHYNLLAREVEKEARKGADGIIITHGTDTMHYTSAALAFILENLGIPVMLVGAQRSSDRGSSDAGLNLLSAAYFIANSDFGEVAICMHENVSDISCLILPATKTRKMHTSRRDAFKAINTTPWARVNFEEKNISFIQKKYNRKDKNKKIFLKLMKEKLNVGMIVAHPNMFAKEFKSYVGFDGLVIEGTGLGHAPINKVDNFTAEHKKILAEIKKLSKKTIVVMSPQTIYGRLQMNVYSTARYLQEAGVLGNLSDMTPETAFVKLAWLLSNYRKNEVKELITQNLRGEISACSEKETF